MRQEKKIEDFSPGDSILWKRRTRGFGIQRVKGVISHRVKGGLAITVIDSIGRPWIRYVPPHNLEFPKRRKNAL